MALVSAIPDHLISYGQATIEMDSRLSLQGKRLQAAIDALNDSAPDPSVLGPLPALGSDVTGYAQGNAGTDAWVGDVGNAFANADQACTAPGTVVHVEQSVVNALVKGEEPQGRKARGAQLLKAQQSGQNGFLDLLPSGSATLTWLLANKWWITKTWGFLAKGGQLSSILASVSKGYKLVPSADGKYIIAKGSRFLTDDASWFERYIQAGRVPGTRYLVDNPKVARYFNFKTLMQKDLSKAFNPADSDFWKSAGKAGGVAALVLTMGGDVYNYGWGADKSQGFGNNFAAAVTVDTATTVGTIAVTDAASTGAGLAAGALIGGEAGSVVPGVGTVVGLAVGVGVAYFMSTGTGKAVRADAVKAVSTGYKDTEKVAVAGWHDTEHIASSGWKDTKSVAKTAVHDLNPLNW